jgi:hypothetical protein
MATSRVKTSSILQGFPKSRSLLAGNPYYVPPAFESIATVTVGSGGTGSITFSSIPSTFTHLQLRSFALSSSTASSGTLTINGTGGKTHWLSGNGSVASAAYDGTTMFFPLVQGSTTSAFGSVTDFLDYSNTNKYKTVRTLGGFDANGSGFVNLTSNLWLSTSAITSITVTAVGTFNQYSSFALYGIKGA